ncbi:type II toxin-antitoxin system PemK/MazF family toxin [Halomonas almeriensis]|nr:type II toxin-antitoxin system PemK/MazF family toxin [Halomonas almeriensis]MDN3552887.1 type II toxin-antitoxin system PemK/MazF family toxin [Halomonas almeriensis]
MSSVFHRRGGRGQCRLPLRKASTTTTGVVLCSQLRTLDIEARQGRWVESVPPEIMDDVLARLATLMS